MPVYSLAPHSGLLGKRLATHLIRRCSFRVTGQDITAYAAKTATEAINDLLVIPANTSSEPINYTDGQPWIYTGTSPNPPGEYNLIRQVNIFFLEQFYSNPAASLKYKMMFFLHQQIATRWLEVVASRAQWDYLKLLEFYCVGSFKSLATKICSDNAMSQFLGNTHNTNTAPNENFAREFLELFTIGKGPQDGPGSYTTYTEDDVKAAARVLTGFKYNSAFTNTALYDPDTGLCRNTTNYGEHFLGNKQFSNKFQNTVITGAVNAADMWRELEDFVNMVFNQSATAKNICRNLYRYFCCTEITADVETYIIAPLANTFITNNYNLSSVLSQLLKSQHFFNTDAPDNRIVGSKEKSPLEIFTGGMSFFGLSSPLQLTDRYQFFTSRVMYDMSMLGLDIFLPESVAGYPQLYHSPQYNRLWIPPTVLVKRYKYGRFFLKGLSIDVGWPLEGFIAANLPSFVKNNSSGYNPNPLFLSPSDSTTLVTEFCEYLLPEVPTGTRFTYLLNTVFLGGLSPVNWQHDWNNYISTGDQNYVKPALDNFINTLFKLPEFQLM